MSYTEAKEKYAALGVDTEAALDKLKTCLLYTSDAADEL